MPLSLNIGVHSDESASVPHPMQNAKTRLTGGQITSTQAAVDNNKNTFTSVGGTTTTDLQNTASYSANSVSVGLGTGTPSPGASLSAGLSGVGIGSDKGSASSTTTAGISGVAGNTAARTGDKSTSLTPIFNKDQVQKEVVSCPTVRNTSPVPFQSHFFPRPAT